jgi:Zn-dependent peptidase ImmA (M78 family)
VDQLQQVAARLQQARTEAKLSTRAVSEQLPATAKVSHATIASYEKGMTAPDLKTLTALAAVYKRPLSWFLLTGPSLKGVQFRETKSTVTKGERESYLAHGQRWLEAYWRLEQRLQMPLSTPSACPKPSRRESPHDFAMRVRDWLHVGTDAPILQVIRTAQEAFGLRVIECVSPISIDGFAGRFGNENAVVLNPRRTAWDRVRLTMVHEIAHVLYRDHFRDARADKEEEAARFEFGFYLLMPRQALANAFQGRSVVRLVQFKERFGVSLAAMVYRAGKEQILSERDTQKLWIEFAKRGWKRVEPGTVCPERATRFEELYESAVEGGQLRPDETDSLLGVSEAEVHIRLILAAGGNVPEGDDRDQDSTGDDVIRSPGIE